MKRIVLSVVVFLFVLPAFTQQAAEKEKNQAIDWYNKDRDADKKVQGVSTEKAYQEVLKNMKSQEVIVAVIDGGVDIFHEDLQGKIWVNTDEIPDNGVDDDHNGYIDDIHGWNFLGNAKKENIVHETLEMTRFRKKYSEIFEGKTRQDIKPADTTLYNEYVKINTEYKKKKEDAEKTLEGIKDFYEIYKIADSIACAVLNKKEYTYKDIEGIQTIKDSRLYYVKKFLLSLEKNKFRKNEFMEYKEYNENQLQYSLNMDYNPRKIIGDNPEDIRDTNYGNNVVKGERPDHGTFVAGIIAGLRNNNLGVNGIAENVKIMALRVVPDGDERDKDVALAIQYAIENGAQVINMSFGKSYSPQKEYVDQALKLANGKKVLLIHAAGNDSEDNDRIMHYPANLSNDGQLLTDQWITVGASSRKADKNFLGKFTNYGKQTVDIFAPGVNIYGCMPENKYAVKSGTSFACPVVAGIAALLMSYYPDLSAAQIKEIILKSGIQYKKLKVVLPYKENPKTPKVLFDSLSVTGSLANIYQAVLLAEKMAGGAK